MKRLLVLLAALLPLLGPALRAQEPSALDRQARPSRELPLARGAFAVYDLPPEGAAAGVPARAVVVFASGGGGWTYWEDRVGRRLARRGCYVLGLDTARYLESDVTREDLANDFERIAAAAPAPLLVPDAPVLYAGTGAGAVQAVSAAALTPPPPRLAGLLVTNLSSRGRNGLRFADRLGLKPRGEGTFPLAELAPLLGKARVAQLHAHGGWFEVDSTAWLVGVPGPSRAFDIPQEWRHVGRANNAFLEALDQALDWLLAP